MSGPSLTDELLDGVPSILIQGKPQPNTLAANRIMAAALHEIISLRSQIHETTVAATGLIELLDDYMVVTSLTANDRYAAALERLRAILAARTGEKE